jgi:peptidoglycan/xylan/chitin deacetylase (PgdA/CDA1 family)
MIRMTPQWLWAQVFMGRAQRRLFQRGVPILAYHNLGSCPPGVRDPFLYVSTQMFDRQLGMLKDAGFCSVSLDALVRAAESQNNIVITFDDGYQNVFEQGLPVLARHGFRAIQFIPSELIGRCNEWMVANGDVPVRIMDREQIRDWLAAGHEIGSHSATHPKLPRLSPAQMKEEITTSKKRLEDLFGIPIRHFAYPFGRFNQAVSDLVAEAGYLTACTMMFGVNTPETPRYQLRRISALSRTALMGKINHRLQRRIRSIIAATLGRQR